MLVQQGAILLCKFFIRFEQTVLELDVVDLIRRRFDRRLYSAFVSHESVSQSGEACRRVHFLQYLAAAEIHVNTAWQAWIEAAHSAHDVDALKFVRTIVFKDRCVLHGVLVRSRCSINIARISIPRSGRIRMIICDLATANDQVMRKNTADSFVKSATDGFVRNFERCEGRRASGVYLCD